VSARYCIGVGARKGFDAQELVTLVRAIAARLGVDWREATLAALETHEDKESFARAAKLLHMHIAFVPLAALQRRNADVLTRSERVMATFGLGSLAEALALAAAGDGSRLLAPRVAAKNLTCAIAKGDLS